MTVCNRFFLVSYFVFAYNPNFVKRKKTQNWIETNFQNQIELKIYKE